MYIIYIMVTKGQNGNGILLHCQWAKGCRAFHAINGRICAMDVDIKGRRSRLIVVYMPHSGSDYVDIEGVYAQLNDIIKGARRGDRTCILNGDWNAVVGPEQLGDDGQVVGEYGVGTRNERGEWLVNWARSLKLSIANTIIPMHLDDQWTH